MYNRTIRSPCVIPALTRWSLQLHDARLMASSDEILCDSGDECLHARRRKRKRARTEGAIFVVGVVAVQTFLTTKMCRCRCVVVGISWTRAVSASRFCVVGAIEVQWRLVECSGTKNNRVELVAFDVGAAVRQQKRSFAES